MKSRDIVWLCREMNNAAVGWSAYIRMRATADEVYRQIRTSNSEVLRAAQLISCHKITRSCDRDPCDWLGCSVYKILAGKATCTVRRAIRFRHVRHDGCANLCEKRQQQRHSSIRYIVIITTRSNCPYAGRYVKKVIFNDQFVVLLFNFLPFSCQLHYFRYSSVAKAWPRLLGSRIARRGCRYI